MLLRSEADTHSGVLADTTGTHRPLSESIREGEADTLASWTHFEDVHLLEIFSPECNQAISSDCQFTEFWRNLMNNLRKPNLQCGSFSRTVWFLREINSKRWVRWRKGQLWCYGLEKNENQNSGWTIKTLITTNCGKPLGQVRNSNREWVLEDIKMFLLILLVVIMAGCLFNKILIN